MSNRTSARASCLLAALALAVTPCVARAKKPAGEDKAKSAAKAHFDRGTAFSEAGAYDRAIEEFKEAYGLVALPDFLFNIGQACRLKKDDACAVEFYRRYVDEAPDGRGAEEARRWVATLPAQKEVPVAPPEAETVTAPPPAPLSPLVATSPLPPANPPSAPVAPREPSVEPVPPEEAPAPRLSRNAAPPTAPTLPAPRSRRGAVIGGIVGGVVAIGGGLGIGLGIGLDPGPAGPASSANWGTLTPFH